MAAKCGSNRRPSSASDVTLRDLLAKLTPTVLLMIVMATLVPSTASARRCGRVHVASRHTYAKVISRGDESCHGAQRVVIAAYGAEDTRRWDGTARYTGVFWHVHGWTCSTGLGWSQVFYNWHAKRVDGSTRSDDGWSF